MQVSISYDLKIRLFVDKYVYDDDNFVKDTRIPFAEDTDYERLFQKFNERFQTDRTYYLPNNPNTLNPENLKTKFLTEEFGLINILNEEFNYLTKPNTCDASLNINLLLELTNDYALSQEDVEQIIWNSFNSTYNSKTFNCVVPSLGPDKMDDYTIEIADTPENIIYSYGLGYVLK